MHLTFKGKLQRLDITLIESVIDGLLANAGGVNIPNGRVCGEKFQHTAQFVLVGNVSKHGSSGGVQVSNSRIQSLSVRSSHGRLVQRSAEGVECDIDGVGISTDSQQLSHDLGCGATQRHDKHVKVFDPVLDQRRLDDFDLNLFEDMTGVSSAVLSALLQELGKVRANGSINKDGLVQIRVPLGRVFESGNTSHGALLEHTKRVALLEELIDVTTTQCALEQKHNILDHVFICDEIQESGQRFNGLGTQVFELGDKLFDSRLLKSIGGNRARVS
mmetsp:Transcript_66830/g.186751  ORF Transcript_66830/g.186751 Transcript_66830/m.186751 type:complete len:274 (-) Transcript_66830:230-1051(-)